MSNGPEWATVAKLSDLAPGDVRGVEIGDISIALYNLDGEIRATDNICTHAFALLSDGWLDGDCIECPLHAGRYRLTAVEGSGHIDVEYALPVDGGYLLDRPANLTAHAAGIVDQDVDVFRLTRPGNEGFDRLAVAYVDRPNLACRTA